MEGTLRNLGDSYGFLYSDDGSKAFAPRENLPADARNGRRYRYETEDRGGRNPVATGIDEIAGQGAPRDNAQSRGRDRPDRDAHQKITVSILPDEGDEIRDSPDGPLRVIQITFAAKRGNGPAVGLSVKFFVGGTPFNQDYTTTGSGHIFVEASADPDLKRLMITAVVKDGNRDVGVFSQEWKKKAEPDMTCQVIKLIPLPTTTDGFTTFRVLTLTGDGKLVDHEVVADSPLGLEMRWKNAACAGSILTENGHTMVDVRTQDPKRGTSFLLRSVTNPLVASEPQTLEAWESKLKLPSHLEVQSHGKILRIALTHDDKPIEGKIIMESIGGSVLKVDEIGTATVKTGQQLEFDLSGPISLKVQIESMPPDHFGGDYVIVKAAGTKLESKQIYISHL